VSHVFASAQGESPAQREDASVEIEVWQGDITRLAGVDAIVNAANSALQAGGGVCGAIFAAAGRAELQAACDELGGCPTGQARATPGFALPAQFVIHAVGPVWHGGNAGEVELLASAYRSSLDVAEEVGARSVAFPAISTGIYGFPKDRAAMVAVGTVRASTAPVERVVFVAFDGADRERYLALL
jgi:O-acetyl-ADP-ribose deacetylase (regulator of RNase III)